MGLCNKGDWGCEHTVCRISTHQENFMCISYDEPEDTIPFLKILFSKEITIWDFI